MNQEFVIWGGRVYSIATMLAILLYYTQDTAISHSISNPIILQKATIPKLVQSPFPITELGSVALALQN
ncbi:hypothetical protein J2Z48_001559 [Croceifilum oryzae]|uniref:Uncharacterized protein n=1 Tax=Croceifilum oryzae TaxID=1553429 RepID=A0AAJ1WTV4_9BACL|nr:hypothetical protein [Croceifilum oryzae]MDQ0417386.1 hypothetical protein [Croceifilum oryzae]